MNKWIFKSGTLQECIITDKKDKALEIFKRKYSNVDSWKITEMKLNKQEKLRQSRINWCKICIEEHNRTALKFEKGCKYRIHEMKQVCKWKRKLKRLLDDN